MTYTLNEHRQAARNGGGTWARREQYGIEPGSVRCMDHSTLDADGFAIDPETGEERCWAPIVGRRCDQCGKLA